MRSDKATRTLPHLPLCFSSHPQSSNPTWLLQLCQKPGELAKDATSTLLTLPWIRVSLHCL